MKCPTCESCEYAQYCGATEIMRKCERHNKKVEQTNKEYMHTCRDDELVALLCELVDSGILQEWRIKYCCADSDEDAVRMWLKEVHDA